MATIQGVYVALFGRPADPAGLAYFTTATQNGADLTKIGDLASTQEYKDRFAGQNNNQIVTSIYRSLFNRDPEAGGLNFFVNALNTGALSINNIAIAILDGAQGSDKTIVDAKVASAAAFTAALDTPVEIGTYVGNDAAAQGRAFLAGVTTTAKTAAEADTAVADLVAKANVGNTAVAFAAGGAEALVVGTGANNTTDKNDTITGSAANWNAAADTVDAGFGVDTFNGTIAADVNLVANGLKNVEIVNLTANNGAAPVVDLTFGAAEAKQATQIWNNGSIDNLIVTGIAASTTVGLTGANAATTFTFADTSGTSDVANLAVKTATGAGGVTIAGVETLNITNEGTSSIGAVTAAAAKTINISGKDTLTLSVANGDVTTVNNTSTGTVNITLSAAAKLTAYNGSEKIDAVTIDTAGLTANVAINLGAGADSATVDGGGNSAFGITLTGGAGSDLFYFGTTTLLNNVNAVTVADLGKSLVTIADFNKAEDSITYNNQGVGTRAVLTVGELGQISGQSDLVAAIAKAVSFRDGGEDTFVFSFGTDTYIYQDVGANGLTAGDGLVKIAGIAAADLTASNFTFI